MHPANFNVGGATTNLNFTGSLEDMDNDERVLHFMDHEVHLKSFNFLKNQQWTYNPANFAP